MEVSWKRYHLNSTSLSSLESFCNHRILNKPKIAKAAWKLSPRGEEIKKNTCLCWTMSNEKRASHLGKLGQRSAVLVHPFICDDLSLISQATWSVRKSCPQFPPRPCTQNQLAKASLSSEGLLEHIKARVGCLLPPKWDVWPHVNS